MIVPVYGFLRGDCLGLLLLVKSEDPVASIVTCIYEAAAPRVARAPTAGVYHAGRRLDPNCTIAESGVAALDRVDVIPESP
jgi:hypothetical protein